MASPDHQTIHIGEICTIKFRQFLDKINQNTDPYGIIYDISLGEVLKDAPEYLVSLPVFEKYVYKLLMALTVYTEWQQSTGSNPRYSWISKSSTRSIRTYPFILICYVSTMPPLTQSKCHPQSGTYYVCILFLIYPSTLLIFFFQHCTLYSHSKRYQDLPRTNHLLKTISSL